MPNHHSNSTHSRSYSPSNSRFGLRPWLALVLAAGLAACGDPEQLEPGPGPGDCDCATDAECGEGNACYQSCQCVQACATDAECGDGFVCTGGICFEGSAPTEDGGPGPAPDQGGGIDTPILPPPADAGADPDLGVPVDGGGPMGEMVSVPAGTFTMGCMLGPDCQNDDQSTPHQVTISAFEIDRTEVTQSAYKACMDQGGCTPPRVAGLYELYPNLPITYVTWDQAKAYCTWAQKRLPTEAEWEYAARGPDSLTFPWGNTPAIDCGHANVNFVDTPGCDNVAKDVGSLPTGIGPFGTLDMLGNVSEWVNDIYRFDYYTPDPVTDPQGPTMDSGERVLRGGSFQYPDPTIVTGAWRYHSRGDLDTAEWGFRCAR